jgi:DNA-binding LytR/AlgR family response regulator
LNIVTQTNAHQTLSTLKSMEEILHNTSCFRIHRAFIVNTDSIQSLNGNIVQLSNGKTIPIASNKKDLLYTLLGLN